MIYFEPILQTSILKSDVDYVAPDGSEIRLLPTMKGGSLCHCTLPAGKTSSPVAHRHVEEIWYFLEGEGQRQATQGVQTDRRMRYLMGDFACEVARDSGEYRERAGGNPSEYYDYAETGQAYDEYREGSKLFLNGTIEAGSRNRLRQ